MTRTLHEAPDTVESRATAWFARRRSGEMSEGEGRELAAWLEADPHHRLAFEAVEALWGGFDHTRDAPEVLAMRAQARRKGLLPGRRGVAWRIAAGLAVIVLAGVGTWSLTQPQREFPNQTFRTEVGQRSTVTLPDGSVVTLNTDTVLRTRASADKRVLYLERGQAFFKVAKDRAHPFVVHAAGRTVTALGTAFDVRAEHGRFEVTLVEGKVKVETALAAALPPGAARTVPTLRATEMVAGSQLVVSPSDGWSVERTDTAKETAWMTGWLTFDGESLGQVVAELGRYSDRKIVLDDPALAALPVSGRFRAGDIDGFLKAIAIYDIAQANPGDATVVRLAQAQ